jgi:hypothetical protein
MCVFVLVLEGNWVGGGRVCKYVRLRVRVRVRVHVRCLSYEIVCVSSHMVPEVPSKKHMDLQYWPQTETMPSPMLRPS